ncbi:MAG: hypothetical protein J7M08_09165 [Planctomycetes bacterium]|nr:hypothetical protein [Planctomycetota bacterium]
MDSRERVFLALDHQIPDRIPVDFWASAGCRARLEAEFGMPYDAFLDAADVDFRYVPGPDYIGPPLEGGPGGTTSDIWGVPRRTVTLDVGGHVEKYQEVVEPPLAGAATVDQIEDYPHWPSPDWFDYGVLREQCQRARDAGRVAVFMGDRLNRVAQLKPAMYIRGVDNIMLDMAARPEMARALFGRIRRFYSEYLERILGAAEGGIDIVLTGDDFGAQQGLLISPAMWDEFLREGFARYNAIVRSHGAVAMHHTCGSVVDLIPRMMDCGLQVLQSLQPEARGMEPGRLKASFGDRLSFQGGVSIQRTLPHGSPQDVRRHVGELAECMGAGGGYIFCTAHNIQADTPMRNIRALLDAYRDYGSPGSQS